VEETSTKKTSAREDKHKKPLTMQQRVWREIRGYAEAIIIALIVTTFLFTTVGVAGSSMYPSLEGGSGRSLLESFLQGDRLFVPKYETWLRRAGVLGDYRRGDVVIFRENADSPCRQGRRAFLVKRMVGLPGDHVTVDADGNVTVNDVLLDQSFITSLPEGRVGPNTRITDVVVPEGQYFVLGDNRVNSCDSRIYGTVPFMSIAGRATAVIWPPMRSGAMNWRGLRAPEAFSTIPNPQ
jgi:signal peptidase I